MGRAGKAVEGDDGMKCKFEHEGDCFNCSSSQYMYRCKPDVCQSAVPMTNADRIRSMSDEELLDFMTKMIGNAVMCSFFETKPEFCSLEWLRRPAEED